MSDVREARSQNGCQSEGGLEFHAMVVGVGTTWFAIPVQCIQELVQDVGLMSVNGGGISGIAGQLMLHGQALPAINLERIAGFRCQSAECGRRAVVLTGGESGDVAVLINDVAGVTLVRSTDVIA